MRESIDKPQNDTTKNHVPSKDELVSEYDQANLVNEGMTSVSSPIDPNSLTPQAILQLQRRIGNQAVNRLIQRERSLLSMRSDADNASDPQRVLQTANLNVLSSLVTQKILSQKTKKVERDGQDDEEESADLYRTSVTLGPISSVEAQQILSELGSEDERTSQILQPSEDNPAEYELTIHYLNDGVGNIVNTGSGGDQGLTAGFGVMFRKLSGTGLTGVGVHHGMYTPKGEKPPGAPESSETTVETGKGPYAGIIALDFEYTMSRSGTGSVIIIASAGIDSHEAGQAIQNFVHEKLSNSPLFPWPDETKPFAEMGVKWNHTINDLTTKEVFDGMTFTGRLDLDASVLTGTHRTEAMLGARFVLTSTKMRIGGANLWVEYSPIGAFVRGFMRYNDGREKVIEPGAEGGISSSLRLNIDDLDLFGDRIKGISMGLSGEAMMSTDEAFQTDNPAGSSPTMIQYGMPAGNHGIGKIEVSFRF